MNYSVVCQGCNKPLGKTEEVPQNVTCIQCFYDKKPTSIGLNESEKEFLLGLLEWRISDHEGLKEWKEYHICQSILSKINES